MNVNADPSALGNFVNVIIDAPPTLKAFMDARARGASREELKALIAADEAARAANRQRAETEPVVINLALARRSRNRRQKHGE